MTSSLGFWHPDGFLTTCFSSPVDYADLDGNLLIANGPYSGVKVQQGKLILPDRAGPGLKLAQR